jgi:hypothetical protein
MRPPSLVVILGLLALSSPLGCVSAPKVRDSSRAVLQAAATITSSLDRMDAACQSGASSPSALRVCREPRDEAVAALRSIVSAIARYAP